MSIEDKPKLNNSGFYVLNENHIMAFSHSDGFSERLLNVDLFISKSYKLEVYLNCYKKGNDYGNFKYENVTNEIPTKIRKFLEEVNNLDILDFGFS